MLFSSRQFTTANVVTLCVYAALGALFFVLVLDLQVVAGFSPLLAGASLLPATALMLALSARSGALAQRIGLRLQLTVGPLIAAVGLLLTLRIRPGASYWVGRPARRRRLRAGARDPGRAAQIETIQPPSGPPGTSGRP